MAIKSGKRRHSPIKTWIEFKTYFAQARQNLCESQLKSKIAGYQYANNINDVQLETMHNLSIFVL